MTLGPQTEQNPHIAELAAIAIAVTSPPVSLHNRTITVLTRNQAALLAIEKPQQQSGQGSIRQIYHGVRMLRERGNNGARSMGARTAESWTGGSGEGSCEEGHGIGKDLREAITTSQSNNVNHIKKSEQSEKGTS